MNKYFYLLAAGLLLVYTGRAQVKKGESLLGGNLYFQKVDNNPVTPNNSNATTTIVAPSIGKAMADNLVVGVSPFYGYSKWVEADGSNPLYTLKQWSYGLTFFVRRYKDLGHNFSIFAEGDLSGDYSRQKGSYEGANSLFVDSKGYSASASLNGGIAYRLTRRWMVETGFRSLAYAAYTHSEEDGSITQGLQKYKSFHLGTNLNNALNNFSIGCRYMLN